MTGRRLLILTYHWPPFTGAGAARWTAMSRHLRERGHEVTVVTTSLWGEPPEAGADRVIRTRDLAASGTLRRALRRPAAASIGPGATAPAAGGLRSRLLVPDPFVVSWVPFATAAARRVLARQPIDCLITSSPPDSIHLAALRLGRRRPPWVAELRDGWTFEPLRPPFPTGPQRRLDARLERKVASEADALVGATGPISEDLARRFGREVTTIRNGWDPSLEPELESARPPALERDRVNLVYTGSLGGIRGHDDRGLLEALRQLVREGDEVVALLRVVFAGPMTAEEQAALTAPDLAPVVRTLGELPRAEALRLQRAADALLLITSGDTSIATGKLYEYLAAGRPILALAGPNEAARIVSETRTGTVVASDDIPGIRRALSAVAGEGLGRNYDPRHLDSYRYPVPANALSEVVERAVQHHRTGG